jgi:hypothetical protein
MMRGTPSSKFMAICRSWLLLSPAGLVLSGRAEVLLRNGVWLGQM